MENLTILVVDDEPKLVRLVREVLTASGYRVCTTGSGKSAVEMAALEQPDLVLLDIVLSDQLDGYQVARRIRAFSDVPIVNEESSRSFIIVCRLSHSRSISVRNSCRFFWGQSISSNNMAVA